MPCVFIKTFAPWLVGIQGIPSSVRALEMVWLTHLQQLSFPGSCFFLGLKKFHPTPAQTVIQPKTQGKPYALSLGSSFLSHTLSCKYCLCDSCLVLELQSLSPQFTECSARSESPFPLLLSENCLQAEKPGQSKISPCLFPFSQGS